MIWIARASPGDRFRRKVGRAQLSQSLDYKYRVIIILKSGLESPPRHQTGSEIVTGVETVASNRFQFALKSCDQANTMKDDVKLTIQCVHGNRTAAVVCGHMIAPTSRCLGFVENSSDPDNLQAWCDECESFYLRERGLTAAFEEFNDRKIVCDFCYQLFRERHSTIA